MSLSVADMAARSAEADMADAVDEAVEYTGPSLTIEDPQVGTFDFKCHAMDEVPGGVLFRLAQASKSRNPMVQMGGFYEFILDGLLLPEEKDRFDEFMRVCTLDAAALNEVLGDFMQEGAARPTNGSSTSSGGRSTMKQNSRSGSPARRASVRRLPSPVVAVDGQAVS